MPDRTQPPTGPSPKVQHALVSDIADRLRQTEACIRRGREAYEDSKLLLEEIELADATRRERRETETRELGPRARSAAE